MKLLLQRDNDGTYAVECTPFPNLVAAQRNLSETENPSEACQRQESGQANECHGRAFPELATEHHPPGQTIDGNRSRLDSCHDPACQQDDGKFQDLVYHVVEDRVTAVRQAGKEGSLGKHQGHNYYDEHQEAPHRAQVNRPREQATETA